MLPQFEQEKRVSLVAESVVFVQETVETNESETKNGEILERLAETPNEDEETGDQTAEKREETLERLVSVRQRKCVIFRRVRVRS